MFPVPILPLFEGFLFIGLGVIPVFRDYSWQGLNLGQLHIRQALYYLSAPYSVIFIVLLMIEMLSWGQGFNSNTVSVPSSSSHCSLSTTKMAPNPLPPNSRTL